MKKIICLALAMLFFQLAAAAKDNNSGVKRDHLLWILIENSFTGQAIRDSISATLMLDDSTAIDTTRSIMTNDGYSCFIFKVTREDKRYIVKMESDDYARKYTNFDIHFGSRQTRFITRPVKLRRLAMSEKMQKLGEVVVQSTKMKFYHHGDTLVYNADAFNLAEGSMLDALIRQLPGAELKDNGRIYVNGKFVESLMLNGNDFFKGKNEILLDNLPAYMVKQVKVYDKESDLSKFMGKKMDEGSYVMDVNLKRQYSIGWIGNAEVGGASTFSAQKDDRYRTRLFLTRFTPQSRISLYGTMNNISENRKPGQNGEWSPQDLSGGIQTLKMAGLDYAVNEKHQRYNLNGNVSISYGNQDKSTRRSLTTFLPDGDTYQHSWNDDYIKDLELSTYHQLRFEFGSPSVDFLSFEPSFNYSRINSDGNLLSGTFNEDVSSQDNLRDSLETFDDGSYLRRLIMNRQQKLTKSSMKKYSGGLYARNYYKISNTDDALVIDNNINGSYQSNETFDRRSIFYQSQAEDYVNRYQQQPRHEFSNNFSATYNLVLSGFNNFIISPSYRLYYSYQHQRSSLYRLDLLSPEGDHEELGWLPSTQDALLRTIDGGNSYEMWEYGRDHWLSLECFLRESIGNGYLNINAKARVVRYDGDMQFHGIIDSHVEEKTWLPRPELNIDWLTSKRMHKFTLHYDMQSWHPLLWNKLNTTFDSDPLNIWKGNDDIKNSYQHQAWIYYTSDQWMKEKHRMLNATLGWLVISHASATAVYYDKSTGARTSQPTNLEGNWRTWFNATYATPLDKAKKVMLNTTTEFNYWNNVDLVTVNSTTPTRSSVHNLWSRENISLDADFGQQHVGIVGRLTYSNVTSSRTGFSNIHAWEFKYGANTRLHLPALFQLSTDITMYCRRGYNDHAMNTSDLVWNARITRPLWHNRLVASLDAFDILGQLSNISYSINAQGRTETWVNSIPQYLMFSIMYKLSLDPKKK